LRFEGRLLDAQRSDLRFDVSDLLTDGLGYGSLRWLMEREGAEGTGMS
jgi:hypothetical protein